jgi:hypothetical protein
MSHWYHFRVQGTQQDKGRDEWVQDISEQLVQHMNSPEIEEEGDEIETNLEKIEEKKEE